MNRKMKIAGICFLLSSFCWYNLVCAQQFNVQFSKKLSQKNFSGRVFVFLSKENKNPLNQDNWTRLQPVFAADVANLQANKSIIVNNKNAISFPVAITDMERGAYYATLLFDNNLGGRAIVSSPGNYISQTKQITLTQNRNAIYNFIADSIIPQPIFKTGKYRKEFKIKSELLTTFHKKDTYIAGGVALPDTLLINPNARLPLMISVTGFGGDYKSVGDYDHAMDTAWTGIPFIFVEIDGNCPTGHNVYANSDNNGPYGDALVDEFLPQLEKQFNCNGFRYITGHSSGGWSSLWLKLNYPEKFNFCWSSSPDYVDFTAFQYVDIYKEKNFFYDSTGALTNYATLAGYWQIIANREQSFYENVLNRGEQLTSFEAVYSQRDRDGLPKKLWNRQTGLIDTAVANYWKRFDVKVFLEKNYHRIKNNIDNQLIITAGYQDNFGANIPVMQVEELVKKEKMKLEVMMVAGDHFTIDIGGLQEKIFLMLRRQYKLFIKK